MGSSAKRPAVDVAPDGSVSGGELGELLLAHGWATPPQMARAVGASGADPADKKLLTTLLQQHVLNADQVLQIEALLRQRESLPGFRLLRKLGAGGMGTVYLATHLASGQICALKVINPRLAGDTDFIGRFNRETKALANLHHDHLANIIESGSSGDTLYLAMEYIEGPSLGALLKEHKVLPESYVLRMVRQVAECLAYVYTTAGLVHRDIKPENVLVRRHTGGEPFAEDEVAKLIDFGLVKTTNDDEHLTQTGMTIGTPLYMSPEQVRGQKLDCRSDIYGLGASMFQMLTGSAPFRGTSPGAIMSAHLTEPVPDPGDLVPSLHPNTRRLIMTSLAKGADDRFRTYEALGIAIDEALEVLGTRSGMLKLVRKPLVVRKAPLKRVEPETAKLAEGSGPGRRSISDRIVAKHQLRQDPEADPARPGVLRAMPVDAALPASDAQPDTDAITTPQPAAGAANGAATLTPTHLQVLSAIKKSPVKSSAAFQDTAEPTGMGLAPWLALGVAVVALLVYLAVKVLAG